MDCDPSAQMGWGRGGIGSLEHSVPARNCALLPPQNELSGVSSTGPEHFQLCAKQRFMMIESKGNLKPHHHLKQ